MKREEVQELIQRGMRDLSDALDAGQSDGLKRYLEVMSRFPRYSFNNCLLIWAQFSSATMVQGFNAWKKMGRTIKKGSRGIGIIAPMVYRADDGKEADKDGKVIRGFKVVHVFDVSQTEGDDLPEFAKIGGDPGDNIVAVEALIRSHGIGLIYEPIEGGADGLSMKGTIVIAPDLSPAKCLMCLLHECAHEFMHFEPQRRRSTTKTIRETEAEAVAHVVGQVLGLESIEHSADYIQLYNGDADVLAKSMDHIQKTAARILNGIEEYLPKSADRLEEVTA